MKAVLTGASGGIGIDLFKSMADSGFDVACCSRHGTPALAEQVAERNAAGAHHIMLSLDLDSDDSIATCLKEIEAWSSLRVDALVNCAGTAHGALVNMTKMTDMRHVFQVNFFGPIMLTQRISRLIAKNGGGRIVNIASNAGLRTDRGTLAYGSSKAALIHATGVMAAEYAQYNIAVNAVAPSIVNTEMAKMMEAKAAQNLVDLSSIGRMIEVDEIVRVVKFLLLDAPVSLTGETLRVDGCMSL